LLYREIIRLDGGNEYCKGVLDKLRRIGPLEYYVLQYNWEDISNINKGKEDDDKL
jgi:hypothetical protein